MEGLAVVVLRTAGSRQTATRHSQQPREHSAGYKVGLMRRTQLGAAVPYLYPTIAELAFAWQQRLYVL